MRTLKTYRQILAKKGWRVCLMELWMRVWRLRYCRDLSVVQRNEEYRVYAYLKRNYTQVLRQSAPTENKKENPYPNKIWTLWLQGAENAPDLVKACINSQKKYSGDMEVIVLTSDNLSQYLSLPDYILKKHKQKKISFTHLSDIIRIALLAQYGGVWMDATCLLTSPLPNYISHPETCFLFRSPHSDNNIMKISSWLIASQPNDAIIVDVRNMLYTYWKKENHLRHYYLIHLFFGLAINEKASNRAEWAKVPYLNNTNPHMLQERLFYAYDEAWFNEICCKYSAVHKLTYKFGKKSSEQLVETFYSHILQS